MDNRAIGIFDSGLGGLTVLKEIHKLMPNENLVYFGDSKRAPYGSKSKQAIINFSIQDVNFLLSNEVKAIVIACNTISSNAIEILKEKYDIPFIDVIKPGAKYSVSITKNKNIGVIGTNATIESSTYLKTIKDFDNSINVFQKSCPLFVPLVEEGKLWWDNKITDNIIKHYLSDLADKDIDTLVLGCTHYPLLIKAIDRVLENKVTLVNSAGEVAKKTKEVLDTLNIKNNSYDGNVKLFTSDSVDIFIPLAKEILQKKHIDVKQIDIEQY